MGHNVFNKGRHAAPRTVGRPVVLAAVFAVLASYSVVGPVSSASAASLAGSNFEIDTDANLTPAAGDDWLVAGVLRVPVKNDTPSGSTDNSFKGTKEDSAVPEVEFGSIPNNKADLKSFGVYAEKTGTKVFLNVFWTRVQDPSGSTDVDFEFNQSALTDNDPQDQPQIIPVRTVGDLLMTYSLTNGGTVATIEKRFWGGSSWGAASTLSATDAIGSINTTPIAAADSGGLGAFTTRTFAEASIDLAALLPVDQGCKTYGSAYLKSRSSPSFSAEMKDFIAPEGVSISNCGAIKVHKIDDNGALAGAGFTLYKDAAPIGGTRGAEDTVVAGTCPSTDAAGNCTFTDVKKGDYWVVETTVPAGHDAAPDQRATIEAGDDIVELTFNDPIQKGTITVTKNAVPDDAQDFTFTLGATGFSLDDDSDATLPNTRSFTVPVGTHTLTETNIPTGWVQTGLVCTDPTSNTTTSGAVATINLAKGETVACTYTNTFTKRDVGLQTQAATAGAGSWNDSASLTGDGTHAITGSVAFFACAAQATATACTTGGNQVGAAATVTHGTGAAYVASTTAPYTPGAAGYTCFRAEFTSTSAFYANSTHTNATTECFLKQAANLTVSKTATAAFGRLYSWTVRKVVADPEVAIPSGGTATSAYTVTVANSHIDSAWTVTGTITVTNPNPAPFTGVVVTDAIDNGAGSCIVTGGTSATIPANGFLNLAYTCTYTSAPSPAVGTNTASASWNSATFFTPGASASGTAAVDFSTVTPSVTDEVVTVSDTVKGVLGTLDARTAPNPKLFTYTVDRTGIEGTCTSYPNTASVTTNDSEATTSASASVRICVGADLLVGATANGSKDRDDLWRLEKRVDKTRVAMAQGQTATFSYEVQLTPAGSTDSNNALTGLVTVDNPNDWESITAAVTLTSNVGGGVSCTVTGGASVAVPASGEVSLPYSCTFTGTPAASGTVTGTATWNATTASTPGSSATGSAAVSFPIAQETHSTVTVVDDKTDPANPVTLGTRNHADGAHTYTYDITKTGVAGDCTAYTNTATLTETGASAHSTVTVCVGVDLTVSKTALATDHRTFLWTIDKAVDKTSQSIAAGGTATFGYGVTVSPNGTTDDGWSVSGQITVTNPNKWQSVTADLTDAVDSGGGASCLVGNGAAVVIAAQQTLTRDYVCSFTSQPTDGINTATATWNAETYATAHGSSTGTAPVVFVPSSKTNETITVVDDKTDPSNPVTLGTATFGDGPKTFAYGVDTRGVPGTCTDLTNIAVIAETGQSASKAVEVCVGQSLTATATAGGTFDRDDLWTISKNVDRATATVADGATADFQYTVTASPNGFSDSAYDLLGTVTVTNPNDWENIVADVTVATDLGGGAVCTVIDGVGRSVPEDGSLVLTYGCTFASTPALTGTLTGTVTWDQAAAFTPLGTADVSTPAALVLGTESHATLTVVDDKTLPGEPVTLGTVTWADGPREFAYTLTKTAVGGACTTYTNIASLVETEQSATADAELCGTVFTGGGGGVVVTPPQTTGGGGGLAFTGDMNGLLVRWGLALLAGGAFLLLVGRRRSA